MKTIVKSTSKGQITLPAKWRARFNTDRFIVETTDAKLEIRPLDLDDADDGNWVTIFDSGKHTDGKGVPIDTFIKALKRADA